MECGDRRVTFIEQYQNTNQPSRRKLFAESQIQTQTKKKPGRVILQLEAALSGRKIDRRVLAADVGAYLGLIT